MSGTPWRWRPRRRRSVSPSHGRWCRQPGSSAYYILNGEVVSDALNFHVNGTSLNPVEVGPKYKPPITLHPLSTQSCRGRSQSKPTLHPQPPPTQSCQGRYIPNHPPLTRLVSIQPPSAHNLHSLGWSQSSHPPPTTSTH